MWLYDFIINYVFFHYNLIIILDDDSNLLHLRFFFAVEDPDR